MNLFPRLLGFVLATLVLTGPVGSAQERRWVRGTVTVITDEALEVYAAGLGLNLPFVVDQSTLVLGSGRGIIVRPPEHAQPSLSDLVKLGDAIEVHYTGKGTRNHADIIRSRSGGQETGRSVAGRVTAVSAEELSVEVDNRSHTFVVEPATRVIGPGFGSRQPRNGKEDPELTDFLARNDIVLVLYRGEGTALVATELCKLHGPGVPAASVFRKY